MNYPENHLPLGYTAFEEPTITPEQIGVLYYPRFQHWSEADYMVQGYWHVDLRYEFRGVASTYFGVKADSGETIGVGCLRQNGVEGELSCLAVLPDHRGQGIVKWIIAERVRRARELGVTRLHIEQLAPTNTLPSYYIELGFTAASDHPKTSWFDLSLPAGRQAYLTRAVTSS